MSIYRMLKALLISGYAIFSQSIGLIANNSEAAENIFSRAQRVVRYDVSAISISIPINGWGDHNPQGMIYALNHPEAVPNVSQLRDPEFKLYDSTDESIPKKIQPLVLRVNVGDVIEINLTNETDRNVGMQIMGLDYDPASCAGSFVGNNPDTTVAPAETRTFHWFARTSGGYLFRDNSNVQWPQDTITKGLFGMVIVEPAGSTWRDSITGRNFLKAIPQNGFEYSDLLVTGTSNGKPVYLGVGASIFADIHQQDGSPLPKGTLLDERVSGNDYRDYAMIFHDEFEDTLAPVSWNEDGTIKEYGKPVMHMSGLSDSTMLFNYRADPMRNREHAIHRHRHGMTVILPNGRVIAPEDDFGNGGVFLPDNAREGDPMYKYYPYTGEDSSLDSWIMGDPAVALPRAYWGDPVVFYVGNADAHDSHTFHQHLQRWFHSPEEVVQSNMPLPGNPLQKSTRLDVQAVGAGEVFKLVYEQGAGGPQGSAGDMIFHCHLYPHFAGGLWSLFRVFDRLRINFIDTSNPNSTLPDGTPLLYPDGTQEAVLQPLPARVALYNTADPEAVDNRMSPVPGMPNRVPLMPDADHPGFPNFIPGKFGQKILQPPKFIIDPETGEPTGDRAVPTQLEVFASYDGIKPGVMLIDPAAGPNHEIGQPGRKPDRIYQPVAIQVPFVQNQKGGFFNPEQRAYVEKELVDEIKNDSSKLQPYSYRMNVGDCVELHVTNNIQPDDNTPTLGVADTIFHPVTNTPEISMHMHFIRFDELGSSGTSTGWNYNSSMRSGETGVYRLYVDTNVRTVFSHDHQFASSHQQNGLWSAMLIEPKGSIYLDPATGEPLGPVSENPAINSLTASGTNIKGVGVTADIIVNTPTGDTVAGISGGSYRAFREFVVHYSDFTPSFVGDLSRPYNPAFNNMDYMADQGITTLNYRVEPFQARVNPDDPQATQFQKEPAYVFSSKIHGDPETAVFRAYPGDPVVFRLMDGAHEEHHTFELHGHRWLFQPGNPDSFLTDNQSMNIGEFFNFEPVGNTRLNNITIKGDSALAAGLPGDYLFCSTSTVNLWNGMWGIFRVENELKPDLKPLPVNISPRFFTNIGLLDQVVDPATPPAPVTTEMALSNTPCPPDAPVRRYEIVAMQKSVTYNSKFNELDPFGLMFALAEDEPAIRAGAKAPEPLIIRANKGDRIEVTLKNRLPNLTTLAQKMPVRLPDGTISKSSVDENTLQHIGDAQMPAIVEGLPENPLFVYARWPMSNRVSLHPHLLKTVPGLGIGATVGFMRDQTIGPGESITYVWYADTEVGTVLLDSYGDLRSHRHHGLFGVLVVEPENSIYLNPVTGALLKSGREAVIVNSGTGKKYREFVPVFMDGLNLRKGFSLLLDSDEPFEMNAGGHEGHPMENPEIPVFAIPRNAPVSPEWVRGQDLESQGESAINYKTERLVNRTDFQRDMTGFILENQFNPLSFSVFASSIHGDPETPVFESFAGDPVVFRISRPCDLSNVQTIGIDNHSWKLEPKDADSNIINVQGGIGVGKTIDAKLIDGAGGFLKAAGDYLYNDRNHIEQNCHLAGGLWGLFRVHSFGAQARIRPLDTLEYITVTTALFASASKIWTIRGTNSVTGTGITITVKLNRTGEIIATTSVDINGNWSLIIRNSPVSVLPGDTINVKSSRGAIVDYYKVTVR